MCVCTVVTLQDVTCQAVASSFQWAVLSCTVFVTPLYEHIYLWCSPAPCLSVLPPWTTPPFHLSSLCSVIQTLTYFKYIGLLKHLPQAWMSQHSLCVCLELNYCLLIHEALVCVGECGQAKMFYFVSYFPLLNPPLTSQWTAAGGPCSVWFRRRSCLSLATELRAIEQQTETISDVTLTPVSIIIWVSVCNFIASLARFSGCFSLSHEKFSLLRIEGAPLKLKCSTTCSYFFHPNFSVDKWFGNK